MSFPLEKGQRADLSKIGLEDFYVGLSWDNPNLGGNPNDPNDPKTFDADVSAFVLTGSDTLVSKEGFVYYQNLTGPDGCLQHSGDNTSGDGDGDDEYIIVHLSKMPTAAEKVAIVSSIYKGIAKQQNFGQAKNCKIRICKLAADGVSPGEEVYVADLEEDYSAYTILQFGEIYKKNGEWKFVYAGNGYKADLGDVVNQYAAGVA